MTVFNKNNEDLIQKRHRRLTGPQNIRNLIVTHWTMYMFE